MTLTIEAPEIEKQVRELAIRQRLTVEEYLRRLVENHLAEIEGTGDTVRPFYETAAPAELKAALQRWAERHPKDTPPIPDEALRREHLYEDRGQ